MTSLSTAAAPWLTSSEIIENNFHQLTETERNELISYFGSGSFGDHMLGDSELWLIHQGDLVIDGDFNNDRLLIINGNLKINGSYDDNYRSLGHLIVLGDTQVVNFFSHGFFHAKGQLTASGLIYAYYNDFSFEVRQRVTARGIVIDDKSSSMGSKKTEFYINSWDINHWDIDGENSKDIETALTLLVPELYQPEFADEAQYIPDLRLAHRRLRNNLPLFRQRIADKLIADLLLAQDEDTDQKTLIALADKDLLIARQLSIVPNQSEALTKKLLNSQDPLTRRYTAVNLSAEKLKLLTDSHLADRQIAEALAGNDDLSERLMVKIATHTLPSVQLALARQNELSSQAIATLAKSQHPDVIIALLSSPSHAWRLPPDFIDSLIASDNEKIRAAITYGQLNLSQAQTLSQDSVIGVRHELARALKELVATNKSRKMTLNEINKIADQLYSDFPQDEELISNLFIALSEDKQITVIRDNVRIIGDSVAQMRSAKSMAYLLEQYDVVDVWMVLANNPYLSEEMQLELWQRAIKLKASHNKDQREQAADILAHLIANPNADETLILKAAQAVISGNKELSTELLHRDDLSLAIISLLDNYCRKRAVTASPALDNYLSAFSRGYVSESDWALTLTNQIHSPRELSEWALRTWYDDEQELLDELDSLTEKSDADWWRALAQSHHDDLRSSALKNIHTPPDALLNLLSDDEAKYLAVANPSFPADKRQTLLQQDPLFALVVEHPDPETLRELVVNGASREIRYSAQEWLEKLK